MQHAGIILAAGTAKALLETPGGVPLAVDQYERLRRAGCDPVVIVLGSDYERILPSLQACRITYNPGWIEGRFSSVQAGLRSVDAAGYVILPVDTCGIRPGTIRALLAFANNASAAAIRPIWKGEHGRIAWISRALAEELLLTGARGGKTRMDDILKTRAMEFAVDDPAIVNNVNTPEEWETMRASMVPQR